MIPHTIMTLWKDMKVNLVFWIFLETRASAFQPRHLSNRYRRSKKKKKRRLSSIFYLRSLSFSLAK